LSEAVAALRRGEVVVVPTDTVYGVAVDPFVPGAVDRLFAVKRRPREVALPVLVADGLQALELASASSMARELMDRYWPGPLTIVMARRGGLAVDLGAEESTIGVRCPDHELVRVLCRDVGPLAVTSANLHGQETPASAAGVAAMLGAGVSVVIDGGECRGSPSTVVDCTGDRVRVLRQGALVIDL
jgi:L-threonylcarbamoyladenylate synthase